MSQRFCAKDRNTADPGYEPDVERFDYGSYGMNAWCANPPKQGWTTSDLSGPPDDWTAEDQSVMNGYWEKKNFWRVATVRNAGNIPLFLDSRWFSQNPKDTDPPPNFPDESLLFTLPAKMNGFCIDRHDRVLHGAFADWSVRKIGLKQLWTFKWHRNYDTNGAFTSAGGYVGNAWPEWLRKYPDY